ncbi:MAG: phospholipase A [Desulfopila sp.]|jgi:phospholipase A1|nr:phospholipase A [Desulfopila sp.]
MNSKTSRFKKMDIKITAGSLAALGILFFTAVKVDAAEYVKIEDCYQEMFQKASAGTTIGEIRTACQNKMSGESQEAKEKEGYGVVEERLQIDDENILKPFTIMSHKQNYLLFAAQNFNGYDSGNLEEFYDSNDIDLDDTEAQFQLSIKTPLGIDLFDSGVDIYAAYTVRSFWQVYNSDISAPFRETNHEPEVWLQIKPDFELFGFRNSIAELGFAHQSNGQAGSLSRSWNRVYASFIFERGNLAFAIKPWYRIQEDSEDDDNPDITDYLGHGEMSMAYKYKDHTFSLMSRNNIESGFSEGAVQLGWSFPLFDFPYLRGYVQYFSGYGESLIDYDRYVNRLGVGVSLTDLL